MTERQKDLLTLTIMLAVMIGLLSPILFTSKIIRAPDILNEYYWSVKDLHTMQLRDLFDVRLTAGWSMYINSGYTTEGGDISLQFLKYHNLIYKLFPPPASVGWFIMLHLFWGGVGTYLYCRIIGASRFAALMGGLIFAIATENASLINAGHVLKIATISYAPFAFYLLEKGFQSRRVIFFMATGFALAFQFFNYHWQIAFYTCMSMAVYGIIRFFGIASLEKKEPSKIWKLLGLNAVLLVFFLTTVSISLMPLANWSKDTNRGVQSGANQGKGGLDRDEAMSWSMPPEELLTMIIPGFFGFSRQEGGENPKNISSYYWGRMHMTQTNDYMGLLPWLLVPLPLIFRRDKYVWIAFCAVVGGILFSLGKYSYIYNLLYDYFPGINKFRVPKMMMFVTTLGLGVFAARGIDLLLDENVRKTKAFSRYIAGIILFPVLLLLFLALLKSGEKHWVNIFAEHLAQPTRYQQGIELIYERWGTILTETVIAAFFAAGYAVLFFAFYKKWIAVRILPFLILFLLLADIGRVNSKFMFTVDVPVKSKGKDTQVMEFLKRDSNQYRVLPLNSDPLQYANSSIPVMFTSMPVQQTRWQDIIDNFSFNSAIPDMMNIKYLVFSSEQYQQEKGQLAEKFQPVFMSSDNSEIVLQNISVLPKAWLVSTALLARDRLQALDIIKNPSFNPQKIAVVESASPLPISGIDNQSLVLQGGVIVDRYENDIITISAETPVNSLLILSEKYYKGWNATVDGKPVEIFPVNYILRGVYLPPGKHKVEFIFDPLPFKIGKYLTLGSFALFAAMLIREWLIRKRAIKLMTF
jgi:hypothetical protein